jgi:putative acetyltransferase
MMVEVRYATPGDADEIRKVHLSAFETSLEADLVEQLGRDGDAVISLVATADGAIVGHILFSRMDVKADGRTIDALGLAPVAVMPKQQREGVGAMLIEAGLREAQSLGTEIVFVVGEPKYYSRFGFAAETAAGFASPYAGEYFQAKVLAVRFTVPNSAHADYAPAFAGLE